MPAPQPDDPSWMTTSTLLAKLDDFDQQTAWGLLVDHFRDALTRLGQRMGLDQATAEDVTQETLATFAQAYRGGQYDPSKGRLKSWLFGIAQNRVLDARRKLRRSQARAGGDPEVVAADVAAEAQTVWDEEWRRTVYERCLAVVRREVQPRTYEVFEALVIHEQSADDVVTRFGLNRTQVYNAKYRVGKRLAELARAYEDA